MKKIAPAALIAALALTLTACGDSSPSTMETAEKIAEKKSGAKVTEITSDNDPNGLVGKTNGPKEAASVAWLDCDTDLSIDCGVTVETWEDEGGARDRAEYIQGVLQASPALGSEWDYVSGATLIRVTGELSQEEAEKLNVIDGELVKP